MTRLPLLLLAPAAALTGAWFALSPGGVLPPPYLAFAPYAASAAVATACWRFRRSRAVPVLALAALACWFAGCLPAQGPDASPLSRVVYPAFALLVPLNVLLAALVGDRGVFNSRGLGQLALYGLEALAVLFAASGAFGAYEPQAAAALAMDLDRLLHWRILPAGWDAWTALPQPALLAAGAVLVVLALRAALRDSPMDAGLAAGLAGVMAALHCAGQAQEAQAWTTGVALALAAPLLQESYRMAFVDELTGLPARRALMSDLGGLSGRYALAMADVDHFKKFNDTYGHDVGDEVLRMVAGRLGAVGGGGRAYRYGGEEFTLVFARRGAEDALEHAEAVRAAVEGAGFVVRSRPGAETAKGKAGKGKTGTAGTVSVTISMGLAERQEGEAPAEVLKAADTALYKAKKKGRNRVLIAPHAVGKG